MLTLTATRGLLLLLLVGLPLTTLVPPFGFVGSLRDKLIEG